MKYDLLTEPWLPALDLEGRPVNVGLLELFARAHELKALVLETPDVTSGVYRMLLAILHRAYEGPKSLKDWHTLWDARAFEETKTRGYLEKWRDRFDLWDSKHPFLQDPKPAIDEFESISRLFVEHAQGNNPTLFDHTLDEARPTIDAASAARRLIGSQVMALGGRIAGSAESALAGPFATSVTFLLLGDSVFETLVLNLLVYDGKRPIPSSASDAPSWEQDIASAGARAPAGHLDLMTWRPRRFRLVPADPAGRTVTGVVPAGEASRLEAEEVRDPFAAYRVSETAGFLPLRIDPDRALWRDSLPFFAGDGEWGRIALNLEQVGTLVAEGVLPRQALFRVMACGFATDKAKKRLGRIETIPIPAALFAKPGTIPLIRAALERATETDGAVRSASFVAAKHSLSTGERNPDTDEARDLANATGSSAVYWAEAGAAFPGFLIALANETPDADLDWERTLERAARRAFKTVDVKLGASARGLKAITLGRAALHRRLLEIFPKPEAPQEAHPT